MDTKSTFKLGFQQLSKKTLDKTYKRATVESRVEKNNILRKQTRNNLLLQRRNIDMKNFSPYRTPEVNTTTKKAANPIKPSGVNSRLERLKQWKAEREKKRLEEKRKAKPIFKVYHVSASIGLPNYENVNKEIKGKPIPILKAKFCQKTTKGPTMLKREGTFTKDSNGRIQPAKEATVKPSEEVTKPAVAWKTVEVEPVTPRKTPRLRRQSRLDSCISCESASEKSAPKNKSRKTIKRTPHPKFNRNNFQEKASEKSLENDALSEVYFIEESNGKGNDLFEKSRDLQEPFGEALKEKKERVKTSRFGRNVGNEVEPLNDENDGDRRENMQQSSVVKTPKKSRKDEKTPKRIIGWQKIDNEQYSIDKMSLKKSSGKKRPNAEETTKKTTKNQNSNKIIKETEDVDIKQDDFPKESKRKSSSKKRFNLEHHDSSIPNKLKQHQEQINEANIKTSKRRSSARKRLNAEINENIIQTTSNKITPEKFNAPTPHSTKKTRTPLLTPSKILTKTPKTKTPSKNSTPMVYVSPFVTISRGRYSARNEFKVRSSTGGTLPGREETSVAAGADYFTELLEEETDRMEKVIEEWRIYMENDLPDGAEDIINAALGQSNLLLTKKFKQFKQLIEKCKHQNNKEPSVTCTDLHGYWDTMYIQIEDIKKRFEYLEKLCSNNWMEILPEIKNEKTKAKANNKKKGTKPQVDSKIKDMIKKAKLKRRDSIPKRLSNVINTPSTPEIMMRISQRIKHGDGVTPNKSILKTDDTKFERRMAKNVLFDLTNAKMNLNDDDKENLSKINNEECEAYVGTPLRRSQRLSYMKHI